MSLRGALACTPVAVAIVLAQTLLSAMANHTFFRPGAPFLGEVSDMDPHAVREGAFAYLLNVKGSKGVLEVRGPMTLKTPSGLVAGELRGAENLYMNGTLYQFVALRVSTRTRVYATSDTGASPVFSEITHDGTKSVSQAYAETRLATDAKVCFAVVRDPSDSQLAPFTNTSGWDLLVFSNGYETKVWYPATGIFSAACAPIVKVSHPGTGTVKQTAGFPDYFSLAAAGLTARNSANVTTTTNAAHPTTAGLMPRFRYSTACVSGDYGGLSFSSSVHIAVDGSDVVIVYDTTDFDDPWACLKVQLSTNNFATVTRTLYDPATDEFPPVVDTEKGFSTAFFRVDPANVPDSSYTDIRFTWVAGHSPAASADLLLVAVCGGGLTSGGKTLALSYYAPGLWTESIGVVADDRGGRHVSLMGCQDARNDVPVPVSELGRYVYDVEFKAPSQAEADKGVSYVLVYGAGPSEDTLTLMASKGVATYLSPNWNLTYTAGSVQSCQVNVTDPQSVRPAPDGLNEPVPPAACMVSASGRLFCGACLSQNALSSKGSDLMVSDQDNPFRFRGLAVFGPDGTVDPRSGTRLVFHGERPKALVSLMSSDFGGETVAVVTDKSCWTVSGRTPDTLNRPRRVANHGTLSPWSVAVDKNAVYWLDQERRVVKMEGGVVSDLSLYRYSFSEVGASYIDDVAGGCYKGVYRIAYTPSGDASNTKVAVYDSRLDTWSTESTQVSIGFGKYTPYLEELRFWPQSPSSGSWLYQADSPTGSSDAGSTPIAISIVTKERSPGDIFMKTQFSAPWVYAQDDTGKTWTLTVTGTRKTSNTSFGDVSMTDAVNDWVARNPPVTVGVEDDSAYLSIDGEASARKKIRAFGWDEVATGTVTVDRT